MPGKLRKMAVAIGAFAALAAAGLFAVGLARAPGDPRIVEFPTTSPMTWEENLPLMKQAARLEPEERELFASWVGRAAVKWVEGVRPPPGITIGQALAEERTYRAQEQAQADEATNRRRAEEERSRQREDDEDAIKDRASAALRLDPISAAQIRSAYRANELVADERFKGKWIKISGVVDGIAKDVLGKAYVLLRTGSLVGEKVQCYLAPTAVATAAKFEAGDGVLMIGHGEGKAFNLIFSNCFIGSR